jgi:hypothetical protein
MSDAADADRDLAEGVVRTAGVTSLVFDREERTVGHVLLLDLDDADPIRARAAAEDVSGVSALWESSEGSFHVWGLTVRDLDTQTLNALSVADADDGHAGASWRRGYSVLRLVGKVREGGEVYRERPTLLDVFEGDADGPQSRPHLELLRSLADGSDGVLSDFERDRYEWVGDPENVRLDSYQTLDDAAKERVVRGGN